MRSSAFQYDTVDEREEYGNKKRTELLFESNLERKVENIEQSTLLPLQLLIPNHYSSNVI